VNELILAIAAAAMIGAAIYNGHQGLVLRGINKRLLQVLKNLEADMKAGTDDVH
jgi:hypothetical protein